MVISTKIFIGKLYLNRLGRNRKSGNVNREELCKRMQSRENV